MSRTKVEETNLQFKSPLEERPSTIAVVIHHIGEMAGMDKNKVDAKMIHSWHLQKGWAGIAYHYVIKTDGTIQRGRPRAKKGSHALEGWNSKSLGINVVGDFNSMVPTTAQVDALERLLADLVDIYGFKDLNKTILAHKDVNLTECPGNNLYTILPQVRAKVKTLLGISNEGPSKP